MPGSHHGHVCYPGLMRRTSGGANRTEHGTDPSSLQGVIKHMLTQLHLEVHPWLSAVCTQSGRPWLRVTQVQLRGV